MSAFEFATAVKIIFGAGKLNELGKHLAGRAKRLLLVCGNSADAIPRVREILSVQGIPFDEFHVHDEPTVVTAREGVRLALEQGCDMVISVGGGSVLDTGKAIAALATNPGDILDYLEVIGQGRPLTNASLPFIALPTTAGTGSEVTRNAVLGSPEHGVKVSLRSPWMLPAIALVDPELTHSLPPEDTASSGLDALTQVIEPFVSAKANPMTDAFCREGIRLAAKSLRPAYHNGKDKSAREGMALASLFGGLALANAALGVVHGFAGPLGGMLHAPHGAICARLLPLVMDANLKALAARQPEQAVVQRYIEIARMLTGDNHASAQEGVKWVNKLVGELNIPTLSAHGLSEAQIPEAVEKTLQASSYKGNPITLSKAELTRVLEEAL